MINKDQLKEILHYDQFTGKFTWLIPTGKRICPGYIAGSVRDYGYIAIRIDKTLYRAHRLAWLYITGRWPINDIDHIDGNTSNNIFTNLREATRRQNLCNSKIRSDNTTSFKGVYFIKDETRTKPWHAKIHYNGECISLGVYATPEEASTAYWEAAAIYNGEYRRLK